MLVILPNSIVHSSEWFWVLCIHMTKIMGAFLELLIVNTPDGIILGIGFSHPFHTKDFIYVSSIAVCCYTWHDKCWTWNIMRIRCTALVEYLWVLHKFQDIERNTIDAKLRCIFGDVWNTGSMRVAVEGCVWLACVDVFFLLSCTSLLLVAGQYNQWSWTRITLPSRHRSSRRNGEYSRSWVSASTSNTLTRFVTFIHLVVSWFFQSLFWSYILIGQSFVMWSLVRVSCVFVHWYWVLYSNCQFGVTIISFQKILLKRKFVIEYSIDTIKSPQLFWCAVYLVEIE